MNWIDVIIIVVTAITAYIAYKHGLISMAFTVAGFMLGVFLGGRHHTFLGDGDLNQVIAFLIVVVGVMAVANVIGAVVKHAFSIAQLGWLDRAGALALGIFVGLLLCAGVLAVVAKASTFGVGDIPVGDQEVHQAVQASQQWASVNISESWLARMLLEEFPLVRNLLPGDFGFLRHFFQ